MKIRVLSLDFDGCLFRVRPYFNDSEAWTQNVSSETVIPGNQALLEQIREETQRIGATKIITMVGSNRQSLELDTWNSMGNGTGSCFPAIQKISEHLNDITGIPTTLDPFLLADIYNHAESGTEFKSAIKAIDSKTLPEEDKSTTKPNVIFETAKTMLLYAQMHHIATQYPSSQIDVDFIDDREDILINLKKFYREHPDLIPHNVTLRLHQYGANSIFEPKTPAQKGHSKQYFEIQGQGMIDQNYRETILDITARASQDNPGLEIIGSVHQYALPEMLTSRQALVIQAQEAVQETAATQQVAFPELPTDEEDTLAAEVYQITVRADLERKSAILRFFSHASLQEESVVDVILSRSASV